MFKKVFNSNLYHGDRKKRNYFEGWYYKVVDKDEKRILAFISGVIKGKNDLNHHSFIQILDGDSKASHYLKFGVDSFKSDREEFLITIENNSFSHKHLKLNYIDQSIQVLGELKFVETLKWPDSKINPGSMGFFNYIPFMECYSHVSCLYGEVVGKLLMNNEEIDFNGGKVYMEKNWGRRFPEDYLWIQSNSFDCPGTSFTLSYGRVPFTFLRFNGFLAAFTHEEKTYTFTTINRADFQTHILNPRQFKLTFIHKDIQLNVNGKINDSDFILCKGPKDGEMVLEVKESLTSEIEVELIDLYRNKTLYKGKGICSGIEMMGDLDKLKR